MSRQGSITELTAETVAAYFDLEFCNDTMSRHNFPVSIGVTYRKGNRELDHYFSVITFGEKVNLCSEQLHTLGYTREDLEKSGNSMTQVSRELCLKHTKYQPQLYISFGKQDEELLKKHLTKSVRQWNFADALRFLSLQMQIPFDISLEKYAYICEREFVHAYQPLEDAKSLADILWCVLCKKTNENRKQEVVEEYEKKLFLNQYHNRQQAYLHLSSLRERSSKQEEKLKKHKEFIEKNEEKYQKYTEIS